MGGCPFIHRFERCQLIFSYIYLRRAASTGGFLLTANDGAHERLSPLITSHAMSGRTSKTSIFSRVDVLYSWL
jgi:hypothetical protein